MRWAWRFLNRKQSEHKLSEQNDQVTAIDYQGGTVYLHLADGRVIGNPLEWHPWLVAAEQRANVELYELSVYFPELDDGLEVEFMMKEMPPRLKRTQEVMG